MTVDRWARRVEHVWPRLPTLGARVAVVRWDEPRVVDELGTEARVARLTDGGPAITSVDVACEPSAWPISSGGLSGVLLGDDTATTSLLAEVARALEPGGLLLWTPRVGAESPWSGDDELSQWVEGGGFRLLRLVRLYGDVDGTELRAPPGAVGRWWERRRAIGAASARVLVIARRDGGRASALAELPGMGESLRSMFVPRWPRRRGTGRASPAGQPWQKR